MDRRQIKTRQAIFSAFVKLLETRRYEKITVQEILDEANIGRSTFYAHFETKDELLKAICKELFGHIIDSAMDKTHTHGLYSNAEAPQSVFCHLLQHLQENDNNILVHHRRRENQDLPQDFLVNHISGSFVEMVLWWLKDRERHTPEELDRYFRSVIEPIL